MSGKEKLYFLLNRIDDARAIAPAGQPLIIDPTNDLNQNYRDVELKQLFTKLEKDERVLRVLQVPSRIKTIDIVEDLNPYHHADDGCWHIELLPAFDSYFLKIQYEPEYQEFTGKKPPPVLTPAPKTPSIIKSKTLKLIAKIIGDMDTGVNLITLLTNCGVDSKLIEYPQTKWRMVYGVLQTLATSENFKDFRTLYKIIEEVCHPLTHDGNEKKAKEITDKFNSLLKYDNIHLEDGKLFFKSEHYDEWISSDGEVIEPEVYLIIPQDVAKLYEFWTELIKITKFYLANPNIQSEELNEIYFELIGKVEDTLKKKRCGKLYISYKRPFKNLIGCEYETIKMGTKTEDILINLYAFLGEITDEDLPTEEFVKEAKKENKNLIDKIEAYIKNHTPISMTDVIKEKITYNAQKGVLEIEGNKVKFDKDSFRAKLLELILKDDKSRKKEWQWDEVIEEIEHITDLDLLKENKKKFYPACDGISKFVAQKSGINDLLYYTKSTVQINQKYL